MKSLTRVSTLTALTLTAGAAWAQPQLIVNNVPNPPITTNTAVPHLQKSGPLNIVLRGTPNAPFALLLSGDAFDGSPSEANITSGFFLKPWVQAGLDSPIHPVLDGIGMEFIRQKLNAQGDASLAADDILNDTPSPIFRFNAQGEFVVNGVVPLVAVLLNLTPSPNLVTIPLESTLANTISLYMQVVELNTQTLAVTSGNGVKVIFDPITFSSTIAYAQGTDAAASAPTVTNKVFPSVITDSDLSDATTVSPVNASDFAFATQGLDFWLIGLGGNQPLYGASNPPNNGLGTSNPDDPDLTATLQKLHNQASGIEFLTGNRPARNNENREFPRIMLPGNRELFHWRDEATKVFGFGILFRDTNTWRNLTPVSGVTADNFAFTNTNVNVSPWEYEVTVTPDGNRAVAVLDQATNTLDRLFVMNLEPGGVFANGKPIFEAVPTLSDSLWFTRVFEGSMEVASDGQGSWVAFFGTTNLATAGLGGYPLRVYRANLGQSGSAPAFATSTIALQRIDRIMFASPDRTQIGLIAGTVSQSLAAQNEDVYVIKNITSIGNSTVDLSGVVGTFSIAETNDSTDGGLGLFQWSPDGSKIAFAREESTTGRFLRVVATDGSSSGQTQDLVKDVTEAGPFDKVDFPIGRGYEWAKDSRHLLFFQGMLGLIGLLDRMDLFVIDNTTGVVRNLTRTGGSGSSGTPFTLFGPWNPPSTSSEFRPNLEPCGTFKSHSGDWVYFFRELRGVFGAYDRQNLVGVSIGVAPGDTVPTFEMLNLTGTEFEALDGQPLPAFGTPDTYSGGTLAGDSVPEYHKVRFVGGTGPYKDFVYFNAQLGNLTPGDPRIDVDQVFMFDAENPAPAIQVTQFVQGTNDGGGVLITDTPYKVTKGARILGLRPHPTLGSLLFVVENGDGASTSDDLQDLFFVDFANFALPQRVPSTATPFTRVITGGSSLFRPGSPVGIVFCSGTTPRPAGFTDGVSYTGVDPNNSVNATPFFYRVVSPAAVSTISPLATASRASIILNVK